MKSARGVASSPFSWRPLACWTSPLLKLARGQDWCPILPGIGSEACSWGDSTKTKSEYPSTCDPVGIDSWPLPSSCPTSNQELASMSSPSTLPASWLQALRSASLSAPSVGLPPVRQGSGDKGCWTEPTQLLVHGCRSNASGTVPASPDTSGATPLTLVGLPDLVCAVAHGNELG